MDTEIHIIRNRLFYEKYRIERYDSQEWNGNKVWEGKIILFFYKMRPQIRNRNLYVEVRWRFVLTAKLYN